MNSQRKNISDAELSYHEKVPNLARFFKNNKRIIIGCLILLLVIYPIHRFYHTTRLWLFQHPPNTTSSFTNDIIWSIKFNEEQQRYLIGYVDENGDILHDFVFSHATRFFETGLAFVRTPEGTFGLLTTDFELITHVDGKEITGIWFPRNDFDQDIFDESLIRMTLAGESVLANKNLNVVYIMEDGQSIIYQQNGFTLLRRDGQFAVIDIYGDYVLENLDDTINLGHCSFGRPFGVLFTGYGFKKNGMWGFTTFDGSIILDPIYDYVRPISTNIVVMVRDGKAGFIDIETGFRSEMMYEHIAIVPRPRGMHTLPTYIERCLLPRIADGSISFFIKNPAGYYVATLVDYKNNTLISFDSLRTQIPHLGFPQIFNSFMPIRIDPDPVTVSNARSNRDNMWRYINNRGRFISNTRFYSARQPNSLGYAIVSMDYRSTVVGMWGLYFFIDSNGRRVSPRFTNWRTIYTMNGEISGFKLLLQEQETYWTIFDINFTETGKLRR